VVESADKTTRGSVGYTRAGHEEMRTLAGGVFSGAFGFFTSAVPVLPISWHQQHCSIGAMTSCTLLYM
jgi:hypothetical protein